MCCDRFCTGMLIGLAAGTCLGMRLKCNERKIRRVINRTARSMEDALDNLSR